MNVYRKYKCSITHVIEESAALPPLFSGPRLETTATPLSPVYIYQLMDRVFKSKDVAYRFNIRALE